MNKKNRLRSSHEFQRLFTTGARASAGPILCVSARDPRGSPTRFGFVVTKRSGGAVERNRVKRLLREAAREMLPRVEQGSQVVLMARGHVTGKTFQDVRRSVETAMEKAGVLC